RRAGHRAAPALRRSAGRADHARGRADPSPGPADRRRAVVAADLHRPDQLGVHGRAADDRPLIRVTPRKETLDRGRSLPGFPRNLPQEALSWAAVPRRALLAPLTCAAALWASISVAEAGEPIPASSTIEEQVHTVEIEIERDGATIRVTRSLYNPTPFHARVDLPIPLSCEAILSDF